MIIRAFLFLADVEGLGFTVRLPRFRIFSTTRCWGTARPQPVITGSTTSLHSFNVLLLYALALRLLRKFWPAVFIAALWAVHPVLTESVTNIVGRSDLLAGIAVVGGLLLTVQSAEATGLRRVYAWLMRTDGGDYRGSFLERERRRNSGCDCALLKLRFGVRTGKAIARVLPGGCGGGDSDCGDVDSAGAACCGRHAPAQFTFVR